ncbi:hypothetical protein QUA70_12325 [Microcoleus sp. LAD1_D5]|uniref:hypothetical protein n=1 Tax=unclassified Microcoleus TaxID=2642155 RepID=UPI002FD33B9F
MLSPIIQTAAAKVSLTYPLLPGFNLQMDFNPIINWFRLRGQFCILHWQAKPFGERRWGIYDAGADSYTSLKYCELELRAIPRLLQIDEQVIKTIPTAVLYFPASKLVKNDYYSVIPA